MKKQTIILPVLPLKDKKGPAVPNPLNEAEKQWIKANLQAYTVPQMCKLLQRTPKFIYDYIDEAGMQPITTNINQVLREPKVVKKGCFDERAYSKSTII